MTESPKIRGQEQNENEPDLPNTPDDDTDEKIPLAEREADKAAAEESRREYLKRIGTPPEMIDEDE